MIILATKASDFVLGSLFTQCTHFYRDKSKDYFEYIFDKRDGIMEKYEKDCHGDPANPINGQISGLFFSATMDKIHGGPLQCPSIYGDRRIIIQPNLLFNENTNLYFADFYCIKRRYGQSPHWVQLAIAENHTQVDETSRRLLTKLDRYKNPFLYFSISNRLVYVTSGASVEVFYTADVDLHACGVTLLESVECRGNSSIGGKEKNPSCSVCNI